MSEPVLDPVACALLWEAAPPNEIWLGLGTHTNLKQHISPQQKLQQYEFGMLLPHVWMEHASSGLHKALQHGKHSTMCKVVEQHFQELAK
eukprot:5602188-Amphidinium_carterae.1